MPVPAGVEIPDAGTSSPARKVLVVDDERDIADLTCVLLAAKGYATAVAYSAREVLEILERDDDVDVLFSDIMMPDLNGLELSKIVNQRFPRIRVVLTSGYIFPAAMAGHEQPVHFVAKPYTINDVIKLLDERG